MEELQASGGEYQHPSIRRAPTKEGALPLAEKRPLGWDHLESWLAVRAIDVADAGAQVGIDVG